MDDGAFRSLVDAVKERTDLAALIGRDVDLRPAGAHLVGSSPWNHDATPSFVVWPDSQRWMDYSGGGNGGGDCIAYVQRRDSVDFMTALRALAGPAGVAVPNGSTTGTDGFQEAVARRRIEDLLTVAATYYHRKLPDKIRREWLRERYGFTDDTVDRWLLGWANGQLLDHLRDVAGASTDEALSTGLFVRLGRDRIVDLFRDRVVFPYWRHGRVCYFIARRTEHTADDPWEQAKYKKLLTRSDRHAYVSPLVRNDAFFGEDSVRGASEIVITEGVTDALSALQCGLAVLSPVTVRFRRQDHDRLVALTARAERVIVCNDNETSAAGEAGAVETARALHEAGRDVRIASLPRPEGTDKIDVNELVATQGPDALRAVLDDARRFPEYLLEAIPADTPPQDLDRLLAPVLEAVVRRPPIERDAYRRLIAQRFGLTLTPVAEKLREAERAQRRAEAEARVQASGRPAIVTGGRQLSGLLDEAAGVLVEANRERVEAAAESSVAATEVAPLFVRGGRMVRIDTSEGSPTVAELDEVEIYGQLARVADWFHEMPEGPEPTQPNPAVSRDMRVYPPAGLPPLDDVVATPVFGADGALIHRPGYHEAHRLWLHRDPGLALHPIGAHPSEAAVRQARTLLLDELLGDFRFVAPADRAHALAALLLPFARRLIDGFTPLHLVEAPTPGSGKGLLCNLIALVATGRPCASRALPTAEEEIRKMVTAELTQARPVILLDNLPEKRSLDSSTLAAVLTSDPWTDRLLGETRMLSLPNRALWLATGNNPTLSDELARRSIRIRLDTREEMPWKRSGFRHPNIRRWAQDHRGKLVQAALVLVQAWVAAGRPHSSRRLGSFEEWVGVLGGVLEVAGVPGFLDNLDDLYARSNAERNAWTELVVAWVAAFGSDPKRVSELNALCEDRELMTSQRGDGNERSQQSRLGRALGVARDRVYAGWRITLVEDQGRHRGRMYALERAAAPDGAETGFTTRGTSGDVPGTCPPPCPPAQTVVPAAEIDPWGAWGT
ncbi:MAG: toprim domain-containing protein [Myxococcales bacterium]|nr:toprim domain-containing protein [Myxococcales bacterium]